ncbi:MAG: rhamnose ABC transporter substrate-binding protein [Acetobacteraceae bacterium]|nr:rhamnose ABC transporter substrate-binding protein [Acetobacteraceae bacterium]
MHRRHVLVAGGAALGWTLIGHTPRAAETLRIAMVVKALGIGFFDAARKGGEEAAKQLGNVDLIYTGPTNTTAEGQIETVNSLIAQRVNAIAITANDTDALVPILKKAMQRKITVVSFDSAVAPAGREAHLDPSSPKLIGETLAKLAGAPIDDKGKIAILSTTPTATNQNNWIAEMKKALSSHPGLELVATVYGEDLADKSYRETVALMQGHPEIKVIVAPTSIGIVAAAQAVADQKKIGQVFITGLGLPSELAGHVLKGSVQSFAIWNPIDLGYGAIMMAYELATGKAQAAPGKMISLGRLGDVKRDENNNAVMGPPTIYDKSNVEQAAKIF